MKFKVGDRVIILSSGETGIIIADKPNEPTSFFDLSRQISESVTTITGSSGQYRVKYDKPIKFTMGTITSALIWENNLGLDIAGIRDEKINSLLQ